MEQLTPQYLEKLLIEDNWRAVLINLVIKNELDPWNVDIKKLVEYFKDVIKTATEKGFEMPSNVILALAVLLKLKAMRINYKEEEIPDINVNLVFNDAINEPLIIRKAKPKLPLTIQEVISYVEKMIKKIESISLNKNKEQILEEKFFEIEQEDIRKELEEFYDFLIKQKKINFLSLNFSNEQDIIRKLSCVLFLAHEDKITFNQEEPYKDIYIEIKNKD
jgi:chromatin segregation and condensation protein Rec8/ScpA/Scc1 (kleisin family)